MFAAIGQGEVLLIVLAVVLLFGGRKIPELARGLGTGIREFQQGMRGEPKGGSQPKGGDAGDDGPKSKD
jgi:sec-independent protein translocase protein TatA